MFEGTSLHPNMHVQLVNFLYPQKKFNSDVHNTSVDAGASLGASLRELAAM